MSSARTSFSTLGASRRLKRVGDREPELLGPRRRRIELGETLDRRRARVARLDGDMRAQHALGLAAADREEAVRRDRLHRLAELVVLLELRRLVGLARHDLGRPARRARANSPRTNARTSAVSATTSATMSRAPASASSAVSSPAVHERLRPRRRVAVGGLREDAQRERLEALLARDVARVCGAACTAGRGPRARPCCRHARSLASSSGVSLPCSPIAARIAARRVLELDQVLAALLDRADLDLVEPAGALLAVARDERHRVALVEQRDRRPRSQPGASPRSSASGGTGSKPTGVGAGAALVGHRVGDRTARLPRRASAIGQRKSPGNRRMVPPDDRRYRTPDPPPAEGRAPPPHRGHARARDDVQPRRRSTASSSRTTSVEARARGLRISRPAIVPRPLLRRLRRAARSPRLLRPRDGVLHARRTPTTSCTPSCSSIRRRTPCAASRWRS